MVIFHLSECPHSQGKVWYYPALQKFPIRQCSIGYLRISKIKSTSLPNVSWANIWFVPLPALKKFFAEDQQIQKIADEDFILLNLVVSLKSFNFYILLCGWSGNDVNLWIYVLLQYETTDKHLSPDGQYVPRIIFVGECVIPERWL